MRKVPELRFAGFDGEWEEKKLSKIAKFSKGKGYSKNDLSNGKYPIYLYGQMYTNYKSQINEIETYTDSIKVNSILSKGNEVLIPSSGETAEDLARASHMNISNVLLGGDLNIIEPIDGVNSHFLALELSNGSVKRSLSKKAQGKSVVHLYNSDIKNQKINYTKFEEQEKIGYLFKKLDSLIEIQEGKVAKMEDFKKSMLQKMFPKKDELVPEFRFDGFDSNWFVSRLGEVTSLRGGYAFKSQNYIENGIPILRISNINSNGTTNEDYVYHTEILNDDNISLDNGAIVLAMSGATTGKISILKTQGKVYQNQRVGYFTKSDRIDYLYLSVILRSHLFTSQLDKILIAGAQPNISSKDVEDFSFKFPSLAEQAKIGQFFKNLDSQIENEEKLLESYKIMKKSLLQKMFV